MTDVIGFAGPSHSVASRQQDISPRDDAGTRWNFAAGSPILSVMPRRSLAAVLLAGLFAFQLVLAGASAACPMVDSATAASGGGDAVALPAMAGMPMADMPMAAAPGGAPASGDAPCEHPVSPSDCHSMAPCAPSFLAASPDPVDAPPGGVPMPAVAALVSMPISVSSAPEPPPPRA